MLVIALKPPSDDDLDLSAFLHPWLLTNLDKSSSQFILAFPASNWEKAAELFNSHIHAINIQGWALWLR